MCGGPISFSGCSFTIRGETVFLMSMMVTRYVVSNVHDQTAVNEHPRDILPLLWWRWVLGGFG